MSISHPTNSPDTHRVMDTEPPRTWDIFTSSHKEFCFYLIFLSCHIATTWLKDAVVSGNMDGHDDDERWDDHTTQLHEGYMAYFFPKDIIFVLCVYSPEGEVC
jgi:hypothetical protein